MTLIPKKTYEKIHKLLPIACVDVVIIHNNAILLGKRKNRPAKGEWWFPGGRVLKGETLKNAVIRKTKEETGLDVKIVKELGFAETIFADGPFGSPTHTINSVFLVNINGTKNIKADSQNSEFKYFTSSKSSFHPYVKRFMKEGFKNNK